MLCSAASWASISLRQLEKWAAAASGGPDEAPPGGPRLLSGGPGQLCRRRASVTRSPVDVDAGRGGGDDDDSSGRSAGSIYSTT